RLPSACCSRPRRTDVSRASNRFSAPSFITPTRIAASSAVTTQNGRGPRSKPPRGEGGNVTYSSNHYDVIIVGTGAGGGTLAWALAPTGKKILLLERGDYVPREKENWSTLAVNLEARYNTKEEWRDSKGKPLHPHTNYYVGGNTKFYGAAL